MYRGAEPGRRGDVGAKFRKSKEAPELKAVEVLKGGGREPEMRRDVVKRRRESVGARRHEGEMAHKQKSAMEQMRESVVARRHENAKAYSRKGAEARWRIGAELRRREGAKS